MSLRASYDIPSEFTAKEKIRTRICKNSTEANIWIADQIEKLIKAITNRPVVLGLATGSTPTGLYDELIRRHKEQGLSFKNVITFNLDEYYPMKPAELQSYRRFMNEHLFDHIDIDKSNTHVPDGAVALDQVEAHCREYEALIDKFPIDIQILGIGRTGHIGFNEPGSSKRSETRLVNLHTNTRIDAASDFFGKEHVPKQALTMGVGTILKAKQIYLMGFSEGKASLVSKTVEGDITANIPSTYLQEHPNTCVVVDEAAAAGLTRIKTPWLLKGDNSTPFIIDFDKRLTLKAVIWLSLTLKKPILKLSEDDYLDNDLGALVQQRGPVHELNIAVYKHLANTITGWPAGKPKDVAEGHYVPTHPNLVPEVVPSKDPSYRKTIVIFSPHPDDDVISMGGTFQRLVDQGHNVHVCYQTSGNIAVWDDDVLRHSYFATHYINMFAQAIRDQGKLGDDAMKALLQGVAQIESNVSQFVLKKQPGQVDSPAVQSIKGLIRRSEARGAARYCGVPEENIHFLELPFYETGTVKKKPLGDEDVKIVRDILQKIKPQQIYAAGDLSDPHGTHRVCLMAILKAIDSLAKEKEEWLREENCAIYLYRGAWQEWDPDVITMAVPMSPQELMRKRYAIFKHQSQKDPPAFPGSDPREFWQRSEARNRASAKLYDSLGLAEYEGMEAFVRWYVGDTHGTNPV